MIKKLIINGDDFGITEGVTKGIIDSHIDGVLTSTTLLVNAPFTEFALDEAKKYPDLGVGIHLALTYGKPLVAGATSFTDLDGFLKLSDYLSGNVKIDLDQLYIEWKAQIEHFIRLAKKLPTHIDSHHHVHTFPQHHSVVIQLAKEYDLPVRDSEKIGLDTYEHTAFEVDFYGDDLTVATFTDMLDRDVDILEIMCHPAYLDQKTYEVTSYHLPRIKEMEILRSAELRRFIQDNGIELITFADLLKRG